MAELLADDFQLFSESGSLKIAVQGCQRDRQPHRQIEVRNIVSRETAKLREPKKPEEIGRIGRTVDVNMERIQPRYKLFSMWGRDSLPFYRGSDRVHNLPRPQRGYVHLASSRSTVQ